MQVTNERVIGELAGLVSQNLLKPEAVIEAASPKDSILHGFFEWDDNAAAHQFRLYQARELIRCAVRIVSINNTQKPIRIFVSLTSDRGSGGGGYRVTADVLSREDLRQQMLSDALEDMKRFEEKYNSLQELVEVFSAIQDVRSQLHL
jgi:hypothetical protein